MMFLRKVASCFFSVAFYGFISASALAVTLPPVADTVNIIDTKKASELHKSGALFIDVRSHTKWSIGHINKAVNLDFLLNFEKLYHATIPKSAPIVIYGESRNGIRGIYAASTAVDWGYTEVYYYKGGYFSWVANNLPADLKMVKAYNAVTVVKAD